MQQPALIPLYADRNVIFAATIAFFGFDFTGGSGRMQVKLAPDASGSALIDLASTTSSTAAGVRIAYAGTDTLANHIAAGRIDPADLPQQYSDLTDTDDLTLSIVGIRILKAAMALASVPAPESGDTEVLAYDLLITPSGGDEDKYAYGPFNLRGTVTV